MRKHWRVDLAGIRKHNLTVVSFSHVRTTKGGYRIRYWNAVCDCGRKTVVGQSNFNEGRIKSCGCIRLKTHTAARGVFRGYKRHAKDRGLKFVISFDNFVAITADKCFYCKEKPKSVWKAFRRSGDDVYVYNGIDRVDNDLGYILSNCVPCCSYCNTAKSDLSQKEFLEMVRKIFNHRIRRRK